MKSYVGDIVCLQKIHETLLELSRVLVGELVRQVGIFVANGCEHSIMLVREQVGTGGSFKEIKMQMEHSASLVQQAFIEVRQIWISASPGNGQMKLLVRP